MQKGAYYLVLVLIPVRWNMPNVMSECLVDLNENSLVMIWACSQLIHMHENCDISSVWPHMWKNSGKLCSGKFSFSLFTIPNKDSIEGSDVTWAYKMAEGKDNFL